MKVPGGGRRCARPQATQKRVSSSAMGSLPPAQSPAAQRGHTGLLLSCRAPAGGLYSVRARTRRGARRNCNDESGRDDDCRLPLLMRTREAGNDWRLAPEPPQAPPPAEAAGLLPSLVRGPQRIRTPLGSPAGAPA